MKLRITEHILVQAGRSDVFAFVRDPYKRKDLIPLLEDIVLLDEGPFGQGSRYVEIATIAGRRFETTYIVVVFEENHQISVATVKSVFPIRVDMFLSDYEGMTEIVIDITFQLKGIFALAAPLIRGIVVNQTREILEKIKSRMEGV